MTPRMAPVGHPSVVAAVGREGPLVADGHPSRPGRDRVVAVDPAVARAGDEALDADEIVLPRQLDDGDVAGVGVAGQPEQRARAASGS